MSDPDKCCSTASNNWRMTKSSPRFSLWCNLAATAKQVVTMYKSEPILAEASAKFTSYGCVSPRDVLGEVANKLDVTLLACDKGDRGEVAAAAWLGFSLDVARKKAVGYNAENSNLSRAIGVYEFLEVVYPDALNGEAVAALEGWEINFTHFYRVGFTPADSRILETCWRQHAGLYLPEGEEGIDLLIAVKNSSGRFATLRVRVKNYRNKITLTSVNDLLLKLHVRRSSPRVRLSDEPFSIAFLIQVGEGSMESSCQLISLASRQTRSPSESAANAKQLQLACAIHGQYKDTIRSLAGSSRDNKNWIRSLPVDSFREGVFEHSK